MHIVVVVLAPRPGRIDEAVRVARENARLSVTEPGCHRFDVVLLVTGQVMLVEEYADADAFDDHRRTTHYDVWRAVAAEVFDEERLSYAGELVV